MHSEIIAELEINHGSSTDVATQLIYAAAKAGATTVKFQAFNPEEFTSPSSPYRSIFAGLQLKSDQLLELKNYAEKLELNFLLTIADLSSVQEIHNLKLQRVKVGSTNITNHLLLRDIAKTGVEIILSTGASNLNEINNAINLIRSVSSSTISLMHCTVSYPCDVSNLNLLSIPALQDEFPGIKIGFSDHSLGPEAAIISTAFEVFAIEKHFTLSEFMDGPDHSFCMNPSDFAQFVTSIRNSEKMLGIRVKKVMQIEEKARLVGRRYLTYASNFSQGNVLSENSFLIQRQSIEDLNNIVPLIPTLENISELGLNPLIVDVEKYQIVSKEHFLKN